MGELLLLAAGVFFGIMFVVFVISSAYRLAGVCGLILLAVAIAIGLVIAVSSDNGDEKK